MEEFTNGVSVRQTRHPSGFGFEPPFEAACPHCGWLYDHPESLTPPHARCSHLVAVAQWNKQAPALCYAAVLDADGRWRFLAPQEPGQAREFLETAFRRIWAKIDSATAVAESSEPEYDVLCRFYFARRSESAIQELRDAIPAQSSRLALAEYRIRPCRGRACAGL